ncbi:uncharacterized protein TM35_000044500 [Trypanosoma theileri]|uniref:Flagellar Member 5 n=1 Tax=Trypanosoma theileri TaxID=67003 RepID=A0A1X0P5L6_9TRYP|nr:uncharacterized protein TM35_000044500 [Trypanosoma theileri]ORC92236.1 hypothetical protein TM35_000044500 [Trypanosoma theileri]
MADVHSPVLLPSKLQPQMTDNSLPVGVKDRAAYDELVANYTALKAKVNKMLVSRVDTIRHSPVVDLTRNYIGAAGLQAMTSLLAKNDKLEELHLPGSGLNNDSVVFFCRSMLQHHSLRYLDLSSNNISLSAGLGLVSLLQQNHHIVHLNLSETQIPDAIMKKIKQALERNKVYMANQATSTAAESKTKAAVTTTEAENVKDDAAITLRSTDSVFPSTIRETVRKAEWKRQEEESLERLTSITHAAAAAHTKYVPSPDANSGWRLIEVAILAPPFLFESEIDQLVQLVFPRINQELINCKVQLLPLVDPSDEPAGVYLKNLRFAIAVDILRNVEKSRLLTLELIGDRDGDYVQLPASEMVKRPHMLLSLRRSEHPSDSPAVVSAESIEAPPLQPVLQLAHERASELSGWLIIASRKDTRRMGVPPSLAPLLTEEPPMEHPDYLQQQVRQTVTVGAETVCGTQKIECDIAVKYKKWHEHQQFREKVLDTAAVQELVIRNYNATFDHCSEDGQVHLKNLEEFTEAIYERMCIIAMSHFSPTEDGHPVFFQGRNILEFAARKLALHQERLGKYLLSCVDHALSKKSITNRLDVYVIAPPSRNAFLLHGVEPTALTSLIGSFTSGLMSKEPQKYRVAYHTTRSSLLTEEPTDLREIICNIILQLSHDQEIYRRAITEVDIFRLEQMLVEILTEKTKAPETFTSTITTTTSTVSSPTGGSGGNEKITTVVVLDGLDCVLPPVIPCTALRNSEETGKDVWGVPEQQNREDPFAYIPQCLSRNVRLVLGCETGSEMCQRLELRGRDSVELLSMGPMTPNDFDEMLRPEVMSKFGVNVSDDDFVVIRKKEEALSPEFIALVVDALRGFNETPGVETHTVLSSLPGTVNEMVERIYNNLLHSFSPALIRKCTRLLMCSRWGIYEPLLCSMLKLPQRRFNQLLRMMRPLLENESSSSIGIESGNALNSRVYIRSRAFRQLLEREDLHEEGSEDDYKVWHEMLTHMYLNIIHDVIHRETRPPLFALLSTSPYERMAVKELTYHATQADARHILFRLVLSMPFIMLVYRNSLGYHFVRDLIAAFNTLYELHELGEYSYVEEHDSTDSGKKNNMPETTKMPSSLSRLRDYIYFLRHYNALLTEFPHLVLQTAIESASLFQFVSSDARDYITNKMSHHAPITQRRVVFFETIRNAKPKIHYGPITACVFAPNGKRIVSGGVDRSVCTLSPVTGAVAVQARQAPVRIEEILFCETAAYHAAVCFDRTLLIYDSAQMKLVSKCDGGMFGAPICSVAFSARGRFYMVATEDLHLRVFETEKSQLMMHLNQRQVMHLNNNNNNNEEKEDINMMRGYAAVIPHRSEDEVFYSTCHKTVIMWRLTPTRDEFLRETHFELPFTVDSGKAFLNSHTHLLLHPAPLTPPADGRRAPPCLLRLCSVVERREVAVLKSPSSQLLYQISGNEKLVATALEDGSITLHRLPWTQIEFGDKDLIEVAPLIHFTAFRKSPIPIVRDLRFRGDNKGLFALGNDREMKFWVLPRGMATGIGVGDATVVETDFPIAAAATNTTLNTGILNNTYPLQQQGGNESDETLYKDEDEDEIVEGVADGEFVLRTGDVTAWDVAPVGNTNGADVVFGDSSGRLTMLRVWSPLM